MQAPVRITEHHLFYWPSYIQCKMTMTNSNTFSQLG